MMNKKKQIGMAILAVLMTASVTVWAANDPLTISADYIVVMMAIQVVQMQQVMLLLPKRIKL